MNLNKQLDELVSSIVLATNLTTSQIEKRLGFAKGRLSQAKSKGQVREKLLRTIRNEFRSELEGSYPNTQGLVHEPDIAYGNERDLLSVLVQLMRTQNTILTRQSKNIEDKVNRIDINLNDALARVDSLKLDMVSGRVVALQSLARLEKKKPTALLEEADNIAASYLEQSTSVQHRHGGDGKKHSSKT